MYENLYNSTKRSIGEFNENHVDSNKLLRRNTCHICDGFGKKLSSNKVNISHSTTSAENPSPSSTTTVAKLIWCFSYHLRHFVNQSVRTFKRGKLRVNWKVFYGKRHWYGETAIEAWKVWAFFFLLPSEKEKEKESIP